MVHLVASQSHTRWYDPIHILWEFNKEAICKDDSNIDQAIVKCEHLKVWGEGVAPGTQRKKELNGESKLSGAHPFLGGMQTITASTPSLGFFPCSPVAELNRKPEARKPNNLAPVSQPPRIQKEKSKVKGANGKYLGQIGYAKIVWKYKSPEK